MRGIVAVTFALCATLAHAQFASSADPRFGRGDGRSCDTAIVLLVDESREAIRAETDWLQMRYPGVVKTEQHLVISDDRKIWCDLIVWRKIDGAETKTYFDITRARDKYVEKMERTQQK